LTLSTREADRPLLAIVRHFVVQSEGPQTNVTVGYADARKCHGLATTELI
jgi:hypothetical protein